MNDIWRPGCIICESSTGSSIAITAVPSHRKPFLMSIRLLDIDDFIENLWKIHVQVKSEGYVQVQIPSTMYLDSNF